MGKIRNILTSMWSPRQATRGVSMPRGQGSSRGRYDAIQPSEINNRHWSLADGLGPRASLSPEVRRQLRFLARYEAANNSYAQGIIETLANDTIGTGPRLQMRLPGKSDAVKPINRRVERAFMRWAKEIDLACKLRTLRVARCVDGEGFGLLTTNKRLKSPVKLDLSLVEADQVTDPQGGFDQQNADGVLLDDSQNPVTYRILKNHPGDLFSGFGDYDEFDAADVIHVFKCRRAGQVRGVPDLTPALPLFAQLRRYTLAVITAAETAADVAMWLKNTAQVDISDTAEITPEDMMQLVRGAVIALPEGWDIGQVKAEQPTNTYKDFKREILNEIGRCMNMPLNVTTANSSGYNYASGRLDHQTYFKAIDVDQSELELSAIDPIVRAWLNEAILVQGLIPPQFRDPSTWDFDIFWNGREHVDPAKEANAQDTRLKNGTTTYAREFAREGLDWEDQFEQRAAERRLMDRLGLTREDVAPAGYVQEEGSDG